MSFIRKIRKNGKIYLAEVENRWVNGTCVQKHIRYIGKEADGRTILFTRQEGNNSLYLTSSHQQGEERSIKKDIQNLNYLFWTKSGEIAYGDQAQLNLISLEGHFRFKDVTLDSG